MHSAYWEVQRWSRTCSVKLVGGRHAPGKAKNQNRRGQRRGESNLPQPNPRVERQPAPDAALFGGLQRFLQAHARGRHQVRRRIFGPILRQQRMKILLGLQFRCAVGAARHVLLQFMTGVIRQLAINLKHDILSNPFTFHNCTLIYSCGDSRLGCPASAKRGRSIPTPTSYPPAPRAISAWRGRAYSWRSLP